MPTVVDLDELVRETEGMSPADLKAMAQEVALAAMTRASDDEPEPAVVHDDFMGRSSGTARQRPRDSAESAGLR